MPEPVPSGCRGHRRRRRLGLGLFIAVALGLGGRLFFGVFQFLRLLAIEGRKPVKGISGEK